MENDVRTFSLTRLEELANKAEVLRELLRKAFIDDAPRVEVSIFECLYQLLQEWLVPSPNNSDVNNNNNNVNEECFLPSGNSHNLIEQFYLQEIFAALLLLADESLLRPKNNETNNNNNLFSILIMPKLITSSTLNLSFYVDVHIRRYCAKLLLYLCFSRVCHTHRVVQALYPLLLHGKFKESTVSQNNISEGLFNSPRFLQKKILISTLLNGVVISLPDGLKALIRVLLLDDRIEDNMTSDAAHHIASLFTNSLHHAWIFKESSIIYYDNLLFEEQIQFLSNQLVNITVFHATDNIILKDSLIENLPNFLKKQQEFQEKRLIKLETLEERLHLCIVIILNSILRLPPRSESKILFARSYKRFCLYNKYFLTPAFRALTLRSINFNEIDEVLLSLYRLLAITHGSTLGPSPQSLLLILEPISPGILELFSIIDFLPVEYSNILHKLLEELWKMEVQFNEIAHIFLRGVILSVRASYKVNRVLCNISIDNSKISSNIKRMHGLQYIILQKNTPKDIICKILLAAAAECQQRAVMRRSELEESTNFLHSSLEFQNNDNDNDDKNIDTELVLAKMVEEICVELDAEAVFGSHITLNNVCEVLATVSTISETCWKWSMLLLPHVLKEEIIHSVMTQYTNFKEQQKAARSLLLRAERLAAVIANLREHEAFNIEAEAAIITAVEIIKKYTNNNKENKSVEDQEEDDDDDDDEKKEEYLNCINATRSAEECLDVQSTSLLVVHLLTLAHIAEEDASAKYSSFSLHHSQKKENKQLQSKKKIIISNDKKKKNNNNNNKVIAVQQAILLLLRVLKEVNDVCAAVTAVKAIVWWSLARADSNDSSFIARLIIDLLNSNEYNIKGVQSNNTSSHSVINTQQEKISRMKVRLLDVLLGLCDYDEEGRTLRNIDDFCKKEYKCEFYHILTNLCKPQNSTVVQVATLHFIGHFVIKTYPRVSLSSACELCVDVFRHTPHAMAKAACASMLSSLTATLKEIGLLNAIEEVDISRLRSMAEALRSYHGLSSDNESDNLHEEVIREHGRHIRDLLLQQQEQIL